MWSLRHCFAQHLLQWNLYGPNSIISRFKRGSFVWVCLTRMCCRQFQQKTNMARFHKEIRDFQTHNANASAPWSKSKKHEWHDLYLLSPPPPTTAENKKTNNLTLIETTMENAITQLIKFDSLANPNIIILF